MRILDIVVNLWTSDLTQNYTPKLNAFWKKVKILDATGEGIPLEEELRRMNAAGIEKGLMVATTGGWEGNRRPQPDPHRTGRGAPRACSS
jgi:hypothetical protein